jgi:hypothetical protein
LSLCIHTYIQSTAMWNILEPIYYIIAIKLRVFAYNNWTLIGTMIQFKVFFFLSFALSFLTSSDESNFRTRSIHCVNKIVQVYFTRQLLAENSDKVFFFWFSFKPRHDAKRIKKNSFKLISVFTLARSKCFRNLCKFKHVIDSELVIKISYKFLFYFIFSNLHTHIHTRALGDFIFMEIYWDCDCAS